MSSKENNDQEYLYHPVKGETPRQTVERNYYKYAANKQKPTKKVTGQKQTSSLDTLLNAYNTYKEEGIYALGKQYAEPSVQKALRAKDDIGQLPISDSSKLDEYFYTSVE